MIAIVSRLATIAWETRQIREDLRHHEPPLVVGGGVFERHAHAWKGYKDHRRYPRDLSTIVAVVVHQSDVVFGLTKGQIRDAGGDKREAMHRRWESARYHVASLVNGDVLDLNPPERWTFHGDLLNGDSIGFCVEARLPLFEGDEKSRASPWGSAIASGHRRALEYAVRQNRERGCPITKLWCHRQGDRSRAPDPGEQIFRDVCVPVARDLGLTIEPGLTRGSGLALPGKWTRHMAAADEGGRG